MSNEANTRLKNMMGKMFQNRRDPQKTDNDNADANSQYQNNESD